MDLFHSDRHEKTKLHEWDQNKIEDYTHDILGKTISSFHPEFFWPIHPLDLDEHTRTKQGFSDFYYGAGGIFWLLNRYSPQSTANLPYLDIY